MKKTINFYGLSIELSGLKAEVNGIEQNLNYLKQIKSYHREVRGIKGADVSSSLLYSLFGGNNKLREEELFNEKVKTFANLLLANQPITLHWYRSKESNAYTSCNEIFEAHVHIDDQTRTPEEQNAHNVRINQAAQEHEEKAAALEALINLKGDGMASRGLERDNKSFLTIEACFNDSHMMTDYFNPNASLSANYACAVIPRGARREDIARAIVNANPELQQYTWEWETGSHTALKSSHVGIAPKKAYDGRTEVHYWYEIQFWNSGHEMQKSRFFVDSIKQSIPSGSAASSSDTCTVTLNKDKGGIEIRFNSKPAQSVLDAIKAHGGWRWSRFSKCWYCRYTDAQLAFANTFTASPAAPQEQEDNIGALVQANEEAGMDNWASQNL